ncbi:hypothetical protein GCM10010286_40020 [Streptomyces toxytricini]|nr:hypothetical protein GCM10010286_40020 [Streptomyces toxytricini]
MVTHIAVRAAAIPLRILIRGLSLARRCRNRAVRVPPANRRQSGHTMQFHPQNSDRTTLAGSTEPSSGLVGTDRQDGDGR